MAGKGRLAWTRTDWPAHLNRLVLAGTTSVCTKIVQDPVFAKAKQMEEEVFSLVQAKLSQPIDGDGDGLDLKCQMAPKLSPELEAVQEDLASWVAYGPRALTLLARLRGLEVSVDLLRKTQLGRLVRRYLHHDEVQVVTKAKALIEDWKLVLREHLTRATVSFHGEAPAAETKVAALKESDSEDAAESGPSSSKVEDEAQGWVQKEAFHQYRGKREKFWAFTLRRPFGNFTWVLQVRVAQPKKVTQEVRDKKLKEISELLFRMAADTGAIRPDTCEAGEENLKTLGRLQRLEKRFIGKGVTESEARNALRLFERELSKANWTADKFEKLKKQLAGTEEWSAADLVAESSIRWEQNKRRQAWFTDACERVAVPLGIEAGYTNNGGCFVGPLSSVAGAALTTTLLCHLAHLDLKAATTKNKKLSTPQFLQGFVDGALDKDRYLVWDRLFSIEDGASAARFCQEHLNSGFFDDISPESAEQSSEELQEMLRSFFSSIAGGSSSSRTRQRSTHLDEQAGINLVPSSLPSSFTPFSGKAHRLDADEEVQAPAPDDGQKSWALTFTSNLELARSSRRRSREEAKRTYHWTFSGQAVKETKTGTESYSQGKCAGEKRKGQIESAADKAFEYIAE
eukprot:s6010_g2.t3